jgi:hypothetical protein
MGEVEATASVSATDDPATKISLVGDGGSPALEDDAAAVIAGKSASAAALLPGGGHMKCCRLSTIVGAQSSQFSPEFAPEIT